MREVEDFDEAIRVAVDFYLRHPEETLIVVTADHETGGLALGRRNLGYDTYFGLLNAQQCSKGALKQALGRTEDWAAAKTLLGEKMGFGGAVALNETEWADLEKAYGEGPGRCAERAVELLARRSGTGWTTGSHSATYVPVFALGIGSDLFRGRMDNTQVAGTLRRLIQNR